VVQESSDSEVFAAAIERLTAWRGIEVPRRVQRRVLAWSRRDSFGALGVVLLSENATLDAQIKLLQGALEQTERGEAVDPGIVELAAALTRGR